MNKKDMLACLKTVADYLKNKDESPRASKDLLEIAKYLEEVEERLGWLDCLEQAGVDNWSGIDEARHIFYGYSPYGSDGPMYYDENE